MISKPASGFTVMETLVVAAIVVSVIITVPAMMMGMRQQGASHAVNQLRADLQRARVMAIKRKQECTLEFNHPAPNQYSNSLNRRISDLKAYRGGVCFLSQGPDGVDMTAKVAFNRKGMSTTIAPGNVYVADQSHTRIYRISILPPGGIFVHRWDGQHWE